MNPERSDFLPKEKSHGKGTALSSTSLSFQMNRCISMTSAALSAHLFLMSKTKLWQKKESAELKLPMKAVQLANPSFSSI